jgi:LacI family transcriptional regulator
MVNKLKKASGLPIKRATIKDVAKAANVSSMTVSNVINRRSAFVSSKTMLRVEQEIVRLNYRRQTSARNLRYSHQHSVGMIVLDESPKFLTDFFTTELVAGLANVLNNADYTMTIQGINSRNLADSMIMKSLEVGGLCIMLSGTEAERLKVLEQLLSLKQPLVVFQQEVKEKNEHLCLVRQDDFFGGRLVGEHLLSKDVKDLLVLRPNQNWPAIENRIRGLSDVLSNSKIQPKITILDTGSESFADVQTSLKNYLDQNSLPSSIFGSNDQMAYASILLLRDKGYNVPQDVRVMGFNGFEAHRHLLPNLTSIISSAYKMGQIAGESMLYYFSTGYFPNSDTILSVKISLGDTT